MSSLVGFFAVGRGLLAAGKELFTVLGILFPFQAEVSILLLTKPSRLRICRSANRKIQWFKSKKRPRQGVENPGKALSLKRSCAADLVAVAFGQDGPGVAIPKRDLRAGILSGQVREPPAGGFQVLETLEFKVLAVGIRYQNVVNGV
jgi:hypothetical protein